MRIKNGLEKLRENPIAVASKLIDEKLGQYRYRIGDYRVIFDLHGHDIVVLRIGHRHLVFHLCNH
jgi:mRNA interferase RelE/StbE